MTGVKQSNNLTWPVPVTKRKMTPTNNPTARYLLEKHFNIVLKCQEKETIRRCIEAVNLIESGPLVHSGAFKKAVKDKLRKELGE